MKAVLRDRYHDAWPGLNQEQPHMVTMRFQKRRPCVCHLATAGILGAAVRPRKERGPVDDTPTHRCSSPVLTGNKLGFVCDANPSHREAPTLMTKCKWSPSS